MKEFVLKYKDDLFGLFTSLLIYSIMLPLIISEHRRPEQRDIDFDVFFLHFRKMPMTLYFLIITISLATAVNFFRDILSTIKRYFNSKAGYNNQYSPYNNYEPNNIMGVGLDSRAQSPNFGNGGSSEPPHTSTKDTYQ